MMHPDDRSDLLRDWFLWACIGAVALSFANLAFVVWLFS